MIDLCIRAALFGFGGICVGGIHTLSSYMSHDNVHDSTVQLCTSYKYIQHDPVLLEMLVDLNDVMYRVDAVATVRMIQSIDSIIDIARRKDGDACTPAQKMQDRVKGLVAMNRIDASIKRIMDSASVTIDPHDFVYVENKTNRLMQHIQSRIYTIIVLTRDIHA